MDTRPFIKMSFRWFRPVVRFSGIGTIAGATGAAFYYRPHADETGIGKTPRPPFSSSHQLVDDSSAEEPHLMQLARFLTIGLIAGISRFYLLTLNDLRVKEDENYHKLIKIIAERKPGQALITVSNHTSTLDDPTLFAVLMPWSLNLSPKKVRWSVCSQEICFKNDAVAAFFGAGKVMPIQRGGGIDQKLLQDFCRRVAAGDWVHIFPEGRIFQTGKLEGRELSEARQVGGGRFKWGIGKLVARAPERPIVIPIYHTGMQTFLPIIQAEKRLVSWWPQRQQTMGLVVGDPIEFDDLLDDKTVRSLQLDQGYSRSKAQILDGDASTTVAAEKWATEKEKEKRLYSAITLRVEKALKDLEQKAFLYHEQAHGSPPPTTVDPDYHPPPL